MILLLIGLIGSLDTLILISGLYKRSLDVWVWIYYSAMILFFNLDVWVWIYYSAMILLI